QGVVNYLGIAASAPNIFSEIAGTD
ncbi:MAG: hypothetical protein ACI9G5_001718, partial [Paracoccaceae bacterium]